MSFKQALKQICAIIVASEEESQNRRSIKTIESKGIAGKKFVLTRFDECSEKCKCRKRKKTEVYENCK